MESSAETILQIKNNGQRRLKLSQVALSDGLLPPLRFSEGLLGYILPGEERSWTVKTPSSWANISEGIRITGKTEAGALDVPVVSRIKR